MKASRSTPVVQLTTRERQILKCLQEGLTNREIAGRLHLAEQTVKNYIAVLCEKLHAKNRVQLAIAAAALLGDERQEE